MIDRFLGELRAQGIEVIQGKGTKHEIPSTFLGRVGQGAYDDEKFLDYGLVGFRVILCQASYGFTGIDLVASKGRDVYVLDRKSPKEPLNWRGITEQDLDDKLRVSANHPGLSAGGLLRQEDINSSFRHRRIIRVVEQVGGRSRDFIIDADFRGHPDSIRVRGSLEEVQLQGAPLTPQKPQPQE